MEYSEKQYKITIITTNILNVLTFSKFIWWDEHTHIILHYTYENSDWNVGNCTPWSTNKITLTSLHEKALATISTTR